MCLGVEGSESVYGHTVLHAVSFCCMTLFWISHYYLDHYLIPLHVNVELPHAHLACRSFVARQTLHKAHTKLPSIYPI